MPRLQIQLVLGDRKMEKQEEGVPGSVREGIESLARKLLEALRQHDATGCAALFTEDGSILSPYGAQAHGRDAIVATHKSWFEAGETNKRLDLLDFGASGNVGYCVLGYAGDYLQPDGSYISESGKSVNVLKRRSNGNWKIYISSLNSDNAPLA